jgi:hypothetical protein
MITLTFNAPEQCEHCEMYAKRRDKTPATRLYVYYRGLGSYCVWRYMCAICYMAETTLPDFREYDHYSYYIRVFSTQ